MEVSGGLIGGNGTLVNQGVIDVVNPGDVNRYGDSLDAGSLYTGLINEGTVDAASGTRVNLDGGAAPINAESGLIVAEAGADVTLFGGGSTVVNAGTISLATGAIVTFAGTEDLTGANPFATFGSIDNNGGTIVLGGLFLNAGNVLTLSDLTSTVRFGFLDRARSRAGPSLPTKTSCRPTIPCWMGLPGTAVSSRPAP